jgi:hypothetical protein
MPIPKVYAAEIGGTINEVLIPTQSANKSAVLFIPVSSCVLNNNNDYCQFYVDLNGTRVSAIKVTTSTPKINDNKYYQLTFDYSNALTKGKKNTIKVTTGATSIETYGYTAAESTIKGVCSTLPTLVTKQGKILTRKVGDKAVEEYSELISIINAPGGYDVVAGTGIEFPISIYYTYQGIDKDGNSLVDYRSFLNANPNPLAMYVNYLPDKVNLWYPSDNESYQHKIPYQTTYQQIISDQVFLQTEEDTTYTTLYYTDQEAIDNGLLAVGYKKLESSCRTEYKWKKEKDKKVLKTLNNTNKTYCEKTLGGSWKSSTRYYQYPGNPYYWCDVKCYPSSFYTPGVSSKRCSGVNLYQYFSNKYTTACDVKPKDACAAKVSACNSKAGQYNCYVATGSQFYGGGAIGVVPQKKYLNQFMIVNVQDYMLKLLQQYYCEYEETVKYWVYYIGSGNWNENQAYAIWTIEDPKDAVKMSSRQTCKYYRTPDVLGNQRTELRKYELPETFIEPGNSNIYDKAHKPTGSIMDGGRKLYTNLKADNSTLVVRILGNNIGMNKYKYDTTCNFNLLANGLFDSGNGRIVYRPIDPKDPFPRYAPLSNWKGRETLITKRGYGVYTLTPEYQVILSSLDISNIRSYNSSNKYLDYKLNNKEESEFIHKIFSNLFRIKK